MKGASYKRWVLVEEDQDEGLPCHVRPVYSSEYVSDGLVAK